MEFIDNGIAIYLQIGEYIFEKILLHEWNGNDKIPSVRELAQQLGVNSNTTQRTYEFLRLKEIIYDKRGIGSFLHEDAFIKVRNYKNEVFRIKELPQLFRVMSILEITGEELKLEFEKYKMSLK